MISVAQFHTISALLADVLTFRQPADVALSQFFRRERQLGKSARHEVAETVFAAIRHFQKIQQLILEPHREPHKALLLALTLGRGLSVQALSHLMADEEQQFLAQAKAQKAQFAGSLNVKAELPAWLIERLQRNGFDDEAVLKFGQSVREGAVLDVRVNTLKAKRNQVLKQLLAEGFDVKETPFSPWGLRFEEKIALNRHPLFLNGTLEVQDEGSQLLALITLAKRSEIVVDFCAGAGGKTLALGAMMNNSGRIYAFDIAKKRLANLKPRLVRSGLSNVNPKLIQHENDTSLQRLHQKADCVLVDAPCSGLGTLRRNPDLKYRQSHESVDKLLIQQQNILQAAARLVRSGGRLIYATCSVLNEENAQQVEQFLRDNPNWRLQNAAEVWGGAAEFSSGDYFQFSTERHGCDGFFAAVLYYQ